MADVVEAFQNAATTRKYFIKALLHLTDSPAFFELTLNRHRMPSHPTLAELLSILVENQGLTSPKTGEVPMGRIHGQLGR